MQGQFLWRVKTSTWVNDFKAQFLLKVLCVQFARILAQTESIWQAFLLHCCSFANDSGFGVQFPACFQLLVEFCCRCRFVPDCQWTSDLQHKIELKTSLYFTIFLHSRHLFLDSQGLYYWSQGICCSWIHKIWLLGVKWSVLGFTRSVFLESNWSVLGFKRSLCFDNRLQHCREFSIAIFVISSWAPTILNDGIINLLLSCDREDALILLWHLFWLQCLNWISSLGNFQRL